MGGGDRVMGWGQRRPCRGLALASVPNPEKVTAEARAWGPAAEAFQLLISEPPPGQMCACSH